MTSSKLTQNVFISYARKDGRQLALKLEADLTKAGYAVWLDTAQLDAGSDWSLEIGQAIDRCDTALLLLSEASLSSEICKSEQQYCRDKHKHIIPILVQSNAPRPIHLYYLNYLDFSKEAEYDQQWHKLLKALDSHTLEITETNEPTPSGTVAALPDALTLVKFGQDATRQQIRRYSEYNPTLYTPREHETVFDHFLESDKLCLPIIGDSGMGKSVLIRHLALSYLEKGCCVILDAKTLNATQRSLDQAILDVFSLNHATLAASTPPLSVFLTHLQPALDKPFIVFMDGLNESEHPYELFASINRLLLATEKLKLRFVVTSQEEIWQTVWSRARFEHDLPVTLYYGLETAWQVAKGVSETLQLGFYTDAELEQGYRNLKLKPDWEQIKKAEVKNWLHDPLMLWIVAEIYSAETGGEIPYHIPHREVMVKYLEHINVKTGNPDAADATLLQITDLMRSNHQQTITEAELDAHGIPTGTDTIVHKLVNMGILQYLSSSEPRQLRFSKERFFEFLLYRRLAATTPISDLTPTNVLQLVDESYEFNFIWGALQYWLGYEWPSPLLEDISRLPTIHTRNFLVALCQIQHAEAGGQVKKLLTASLRTPIAESKRFAVIGAYVCQDKELLTEALVDEDDAIQLLATEYIGYIYDSSPQEALHMLEELANRIPKGLIGQIRSLDYLGAMLYLTILLGPKYLTEKENVARIVEIWVALSRKLLPKMIYMPVGGKLTAKLVRDFIIDIVSRVVTNGFKRNVGGWIDGVAFKEFFDMPLPQRTVISGLSPYISGAPLDEPGMNLIFDLSQIDNGLFFSLVRATLACQGFSHWEATMPLVLRMFTEGNAISRGAAIAGIGICLLKDEWVSQDKLEFYINFTLNYSKASPYGEMTFNGRKKPGWVVYYLGVAIYHLAQFEPDVADDLLADYLKEVLWTATDAAYFDNTANDLALLAVDTEVVFVLKCLRKLYQECIETPLNQEAIYRVILLALGQLYMKYPDDVDTFLTVLETIGPKSRSQLLMDIHKNEHNLYALNLMSSRFEHFFAEIISGYPFFRDGLFKTIVEKYPQIERYPDAVRQLVTDIIHMMEAVMNP